MTPEAEIQQAVFQWRDKRVNQESRLRWLYAIHNGGARTGKGWGVAKATGLTRGVPDICLPVPIGEWCGLYVEIKTLTGTLSDEQAEWIDGLRAMSYRAEVGRGLDHTLAIICEHLDIERGY